MRKGQIAGERADESCCLNLGVLSIPLLIYLRSQYLAHSFLCTVYQALTLYNALCAVIIREISMILWITGLLVAKNDGLILPISKAFAPALL